MLDLITAFPEHLRSAAEICRKTALKPAERTINNVVITGLGGSGIGGSLIADWAQNQCKVPVIVNKDYHIPAFVGSNTLVLACSYSGNTEETLMALAESLEAGAMAAVITSGGMMARRASENGLNSIIVPGGNPPRSMLGFSMVALSHYFVHYGLASGIELKDWDNWAAFLQNDQDNIRQQAAQLAPKLAGKTFVVYAASGMGAVATRWRQQLNENAKMPGWDAVVPEMNHNELVGWAGGNESHAAVFLRSNHDYERNQLRMDISREAIMQYTQAVYDIWAKHHSLMGEMLYLIHWGDWLSYYLHEINQVDIMDIKVIDHLKHELSKV
jgi:glucose/mannose-6-phosphate isomerase